MKKLLLASISKSLVLSALLLINPAFMLSRADETKDSVPPIQLSKYFSGKTTKECEENFHKIEDRLEFQSTIGREKLTSAWVKCLRQSMNLSLDRRLLPLKKADPKEFEFEMNLQKQFNSLISKLCSCDITGTVRGISYNFCVAGLYKYRGIQAQEISKNQYSLPTDKSGFLSKNRKRHASVLAYFTDYSKLFCKMPNSVWASGQVPADCEKAILNDIDGLDISEDPCDLS